MLATGVRLQSQVNGLFPMCVSIDPAIHTAAHSTSVSLHIYIVQIEYWGDSDDNDDNVVNMMNKTGLEGKRYITRTSWDQDIYMV